MSAEETAGVPGLYLRPLRIDPAACSAPGALPLAGGILGFRACEVIRRNAGTTTRTIEPVAGLAARQGPNAEVWLDRLAAPRAPFAGVAMDRPQVMGVINVTPDSFSDGGDRFDAGAAVADGLAMSEAGAAFLDVGGESTRPGAEPVPLEEELRRVLPVVRGLAGHGAAVSIDSRHARVMAEALEAGATLVNDVSALTGDPDSLPLVAEAGVPVILMHMQGEPRTMQAGPRYDDVTLDVFDALMARVEACETAGIARERIMLDPGIGFGKTLDHNLQLLEQLALFHGAGCPLLLGVSRKSFIGRLSGNPPPKARMPGSLAAALAGVERGVQVLRVHDVAETLQALEVWQAIAGAEPEPAAAAP
jgi:dihydropteroate synthase